MSFCVFAFCCKLISKVLAFSLLVVCNVYSSCAPWLQKVIMLLLKVFSGVDEPYLCEDVIPNNSFSNMENVRLKTTVSLENEVL